MGISLHSYHKQISKTYTRKEFYMWKNNRMGYFRKHLTRIPDDDEIDNDHCEWLLNTHSISCGAYRKCYLTKPFH